MELPFSGERNLIFFSTEPSLSAMCDFNCIHPAPVSKRMLYDGNGFGLSYLIKGRGEYYDWQGKTHALSSGCFFVFHSGREIEFVYDRTEEFQECYIYMSAETADALSAWNCMPDESVGVKRVLPVSMVVGEYLQLYACMGRDDAASRVESLALIMRLFSHLKRSVRGSKEEDPVLRHICERIEATLDRSMSLPAILADSDRPYQELRTHFREAMGIPMGEYRIRRRIRRAADLLQKYSVQETAYMLGYPDPFSFSRQFRKIAGSSPREFKRSGCPTVLGLVRTEGQTSNR